MIELITLPRTGQSPLQIRGELLAASDGERQAGQERNRWHKLEVYRTPFGNYVVRIAYRTHWQGEIDHDVVAVVGAPEGVATVLRDYDPCSVVQGYPKDGAYRERQAALLADVARRYQAQVSAALSLAPEFVEVAP